MKSGIITAVTSALLFSGVANAAEINVLSTQATEQTYRELVPQFEQASGHKVTTIFTRTLDANKRLAAGETYDLLIMSGPSIDEHIKAGKGRARRPRRSRQIGRGRRRARRRAEARHRHD
jgi:molybdate transport system substrate-binding protein